MIHFSTFFLIHLLSITDYKGLGFILFVATLILVIGFDKLVKLIIWIVEKVEEKRNNK